MIESVLSLLGEARKMAWKSFSILVYHSTGSCLFRLSGIITIGKLFLSLELNSQPAKQENVLENKCVFKHTEKDNCVVPPNSIISCYLIGIFLPKTGWEKNPYFK